MLSYGDSVKLKHCTTLHWLHSNGLAYPRGSELGQVSGFDGSNNHSIWIVKSAHGDESEPKGVVAEGATIRLQHFLTKKNLHSDAEYESPIAKQQEVSTNGDDGVGNEGDNWRVWFDKGKLLLEHALTGKVLRSNIHKYPMWGQYQQEVACTELRDKNSYWMIMPAPVAAKDAGGKKRPGLRFLLGRATRELVEHGLIKTEGRLAKLVRMQLSVERSVNRVRQSSTEVSAAIEDVKETFRVFEHRPFWDTAVDTFIKESPKCGEPHEVVQLALKALVAGDLNAAPHSCAVLLLESEKPRNGERRPSLRGQIWPSSVRGGMTSTDGVWLNVVAATDEAASAFGGRLKTHARWKPQTNHSLSKEAFEVCKTGKALLRSPYGTFDGASLVPLKQRDGRLFGLMISGPAARPDELLERVATAVGPVLERVWKAARIRSMGKLACAYVRLHANSSLYHAEFEAYSHEESATLALKNSKRSEQSNGSFTDKPKLRSSQSETVLIGDWEPLRNVHGTGMRAYSVELTTQAGAPIGSLEARVGQTSPLDSPTLALFHTAGKTLTATTEKICEMLVGEPEQYNDVEAFGIACRHVAQTSASAELQGQLKEQLLQVELSKLVAEVKTYPSPKDEVKQVLIAVLTLFGVKRNSLKTWEEVKKQLTPSLTREILALNVTDSNKCWFESARVLHDIDIDKLLEDSPQPVAAILKWLMAVRLVRELALSLAATGSMASLSRSSSRSSVTSDEDGESKPKRPTLLSAMKHLHGSASNLLAGLSPASQRPRLALGLGWSPSFRRGSNASIAPSVTSTAPGDSPAPPRSALSRSGSIKERKNSLTWTPDVKGVGSADPLSPKALSAPPRGSKTSRVAPSPLKSPRGSTEVDHIGVMEAYLKAQAEKSSPSAKREEDVNPAEAPPTEAPSAAETAASAEAPSSTEAPPPPTPPTTEPPASTEEATAATEVSAPTEQQTSTEAPPSAQSTPRAPMA